MRILYINNDGAGFADYRREHNGRTVFQDQDVRSPDERLPDSSESSAGSKGLCPPGKRPGYDHAHENRRCGFIALGRPQKLQSLNRRPLLCIQL